MPNKKKRSSRKHNGQGASRNPLVVWPLRETVTVPFHSYNTMSSAVQSFYVHPDNLGLSHLSGIANYFKLWRCRELAMLVYPAYVSGTPYSAAASYTSDASVTAASVAEMSQQDNFVLVVATEAMPHEMVVTRALLSKITRKWLSTTAPSISNYRDTADGLISTYTAAATAFYYIRGVLEFCDPVSSGYQLDDVLEWQHGGTPPVPEPVPVDPPNPEFKVARPQPMTRSGLPRSIEGTSVSTVDSESPDVVVVPRQQVSETTASKDARFTRAPSTLSGRGLPTQGVLGVGPKSPP